MATISRRYFMFGALLTGAAPRPSIASLKALGYQSPNEKLNVAGIGAGGQPLSDMRRCQGENIVALADVDWKRGEQGFKTFEKATKYKDFRQMLDKEGKNIDAVVIGTPDHMHAYAALACMQAGKSVYVEKPLTRTPWEARLLTQAAEKYKVATQMGNQGYSHDATRVACEIFWSGEIGEVREVHAWTGRASWPQEMTKTPAPTPAPDTLDWDLWLGTAAMRPFTAGDQEYKDFIAARDARRPRLGGGGGGPVPGGAPAGRGGGGFPGADSFGFYLPFNWRAFYDFGSGLIGDWGVHILGPANWALQLHPKHLVSVECIKKNMLPPFTFPDELTIKYEFGARGSMPPVTVYWYHSPGGDAYLPPGMTVEQARKISGKGPQVGPVGGARPAGAPVERLPQAARRVRLKASDTTVSLSARRATSARAVAAKALDCCPANAGRNTNCPPNTCRARQAPARAATTRRTSAIGFARAKAARPPAPISASPGRTPNGWCWAPSPCALTASCYGTTPKAKSPTTKRPTSWCARFIARAGKSNSNRHPLTVILGRTINDYDQT